MSIKNLNALCIGSDKIIGWMKNNGFVKQQNMGFGYYLKPTKMVPEKLGTGSRRPKGNMDYLPQPGWGGFSSSAGNNRAGNAIPCMESSNWLYKDRSAPNFPLKRSSKFGKEHNKMISTMKRSYYNKRGANGFQQVPKSIYSSGNVPLYNESPYDGARVGSALPRPYGPRDNADMKGYPAYPVMGFGSAPFMNEGYNVSLTPQEMSGFGSAPFMNEGYNVSLTPREMSGFGKDASLAEMTGYKNAKPQFRPHKVRSYKSVKQSYANKNLYLPTWNPYQDTVGRTHSQDTIARNAKAISRRDYNNVGFGSAFQGATPGPNNVNYRNPMLVYEGAGANSVNFLTGNQYYKPCKMPSRQFPKPMKVQKNNNPTGWLAKAKKLKYLNSGFGEFENNKDGPIKKLEKKVNEIVQKEIGSDDLGAYIFSMLQSGDKQEEFMLANIFRDIMKPNSIDKETQSILLNLLIYILYKGDNIFKNGTQKELVGFLPELKSYIDKLFTIVHSKLKAYIELGQGKKTVSKGKIKYFNNLIQAARRYGVVDNFQGISQINKNNVLFSRLVEYFSKVDGLNVMLDIEGIIRDKKIDIQEKQEQLINYLNLIWTDVETEQRILEEDKVNDIIGFLNFLIKSDKENLKDMVFKIFEDPNISIENVRTIASFFHEFDHLKKLIQDDNVEKSKASYAKRTGKFGNSTKKQQVPKPVKGNWSYPKEPWVDKGGPYTTGLFNAGGASTGSGLQRVGQPLELYTYMNTPYGGYQYPEFSGPRQWMGGFGAVKKKTTKKKTTKKVAPKKKTTKKTVKKKAVPKPGDTIVVGKKGMKLIKSKQ